MLGSSKINIDGCLHTFDCITHVPPYMTKIGKISKSTFFPYASNIVPDIIFSPTMAHIVEHVRDI